MSSSFYLALMRASIWIVALYCVFNTGMAQEDSTFLDHAKQCANWLDSIAVGDDQKCFWPVTPEESDSAVATLYSGTSGVVLFYLEAYHASGEDHFLEQAIRGGRWLVDEVDKFNDETDCSLFSGAAGIGYTLDRLSHVSKREEFKIAGDKCFQFVIYWMNYEKQETLTNHKQ